MLRLILSLLEEYHVADHQLSVPEGCRWHSEALLPSAFLPRSRADRLGESWTHADGVIGHFTIGDAAKGDLTLLSNANHFVVLEAKMFSKLSSGVSHARYYDQAARNVACIAEVLRRTNRQPSEFSSLGFYVLAPQVQIEQGVFSRDLEPISIEEKVRRRVSEYEGEKDAWFHESFKPVLDHIQVHAISWEELIEAVQGYDRSVGQRLRDFYDQCLRHNQPRRNP